MPAVLNAIHDRGEGDAWAIKHLTSDDLGDLYDEHVGPALDQVQAVRSAPGARPAAG